MKDTTKQHLKILIIDDSAEDRSLVRNFFKPKGYEVLEAEGGRTGIFQTNHQNPDLVILDYTLSDMDGVSVCAELKKQKPEIPILMFSIEKDVRHKVKAFQTGVDDYVVKPCELEELEIRIQNLVNKTRKLHRKVLKLGDIELHPASHKVTVSGKQIELTIKEFQLLEYLMNHVGTAVTRNMILNHVWKDKSETFTNIVDVYITYLRKKIDADSQNSYIKTVRGIGYMIEKPPEAFQEEVILKKAA